MIIRKKILIMRRLFMVIWQELRTLEQLFGRGWKSLPVCENPSSNSPELGLSTRLLPVDDRKTILQFLHLSYPSECAILLFNCSAVRFHHHSKPFLNCCHIPQRASSKWRANRLPSKSGDARACCLSPERSFANFSKSAA